MTSSHLDHDSSYDQLLGLIYESTMDRGCWQSFLDLLARSLHSNTGMLRMQNLKSQKLGFCVFSRDMPEIFDRYEDHYVKLDPWLPIMKQNPVGSVILSSEVASDTELKSTEYYNGFMRPQGRHYLMGGFAAREAETVATIGIHRSFQQGDFIKAERVLLQRLMPHLNRAFKLNHLLASLEDQSCCLNQLVQRDPLGVIILDVHGKPVMMNNRGEQLLDNRDLLLSGGKLYFPIPGENASFKQALVEAQGNPPKISSLTLSRPLGGRPYSILLSPFDPQQFPINEGSDRAAVVLFVYDPEQAVDLSKEILRGQFGLTPAEVRLSQALADGKSLEQASELFGISKNTSRVQLRAVFAKTNTNSQASLVRLLLLLPRALI